MGPAPSPVIGYQGWHEALFLHWPVSPDELRAQVDARLEVDTFDGRAYVSLTPFTLRGGRLRFMPRLPFVSSFLELNLRTYVRPRDGGEPGVWFFSLDAGSALASALARAGLGLPYFPARMERSFDGEVHRFWSERLGAAQPRAAFTATWTVGASLRDPPGSLEHFLVERYALYSTLPRTLVRVGVRHRPWPLRTARVEHVEETLTRTAGISVPDVPPMAHFSDGVDVEFFLPERVGVAGPRR